MACPRRKKSNCLILFAFSDLPTMTEPLIASIDLDNKCLWCTTPGGAAVFEVELDYKPKEVACSATEIFVGGYDLEQICVFRFSGQHLQSIPLESTPYYIVVHKSGLKFACGLENGTITIYDKHDDNWSITKQSQASERYIAGLAWINDEQICSGCLQAGSIIIRNFESGEQIKIIQAKHPELRELSPVSNDDRFIFSGYYTGVVRRHNLVDGSSVEVKIHKKYIAFICLDDDTVLTCSDDKTVAAFDIETLTEKWRYQCDNTATSIVVFNEEVFVGVFKSFIVVLNLNTGGFVRQFDRKYQGHVRLAVEATVSPYAGLKFED